MAPAASVVDSTSASSPRQGQDGSLASQSASPINVGIGLPQVATPDDDRDGNYNNDGPGDSISDDEDAAQLASLLPSRRGGGGGGGGGSRSRDPGADQAIMGTADEGNFEVYDKNGELVKGYFISFLLQFALPVPSDEEGSDEEFHFPYVAQARAMAQRQLLGQAAASPDDSAAFVNTPPFSTTMVVDYAHIHSHSPDLADAIQSDYVRFEPFLQQAVEVIVKQQDSNLSSKETLYFVSIVNLEETIPLRQLLMDRVGRLTAVRGTVTRTSEVRPELLAGTFRCNKCGLLAENLQQQYHYTRPTLCRNPRCQNASPKEFLLEVSLSRFGDWQKLRVQECSEEIPPGSMPRSMDIIVRNEMVERPKAGDLCVFVGSLVVLPDGSALARAGETPTSARREANRNNGNNGGGVRGLKALGVRELTYRTCFVASTVLTAEQASKENLSTCNWGNPDNSNNSTSPSLTQDPHHRTTEQIAQELTEEQRRGIEEMQKSPNLYERMVESMAPTIFGHKEVKRGILLMLLGGVHKTTPEGMRLRGDINVCVVGDPSTAKSQFLKYVHKFWPSRSVYTSGKASSAAGLTAAVTRDPETGEYGIEAGALMLADHGICCIDEFDKMEVHDQVAIHEAMEQQTISITKAGIQATLNARASILAAANPIAGRYDRTKTLRANVALSAPILSRFDLFFVVLDDCNEDSDRSVAQHILNVHRCQQESVDVPYTQEQMQTYIRFARTINPKITEESQQVLVDSYRKLRQGDSLGRSRTAYRITVRQLESMVRLSEALARLHCDDLVRPSYVREAFRLLRKSIIHVETEDVTLEEDEGGRMDVDNGEDQDRSHPGEYRPEAEPDTADQQMEDGQDEQAGADKTTEQTHADKGLPAEEPTLPEEPARKKKRKIQITFEDFDTISLAIATHLRKLESRQDDGSNEHNPTYLTWKEVVEWHLEQSKELIGDSAEEMARMRKVTNLVVRRLIHVEQVLIIVGQPPTNKREEQQARLAVHPNYDMS